MNKPTGLPDGQISDLAVQPPSQKYSPSPLGRNSFIDSPRPVPHEGRLAIVTDAGRDAVDVRSAFDEGAGLRTAKSCGPDASTPASSLRKQFRRRR
jgi:hypothetical protein